MLTIILGCCPAAFLNTYSPHITLSLPLSTSSSQHLHQEGALHRKRTRQPPGTKPGPLFIYLVSGFPWFLHKEIPCPVLWITLSITCHISGKKKKIILTFSCIFKLSLSTDIFLHLGIFICLRHSHLWHKTKWPTAPKSNWVSKPICGPGRFLSPPFGLSFFNSWKSVLCSHRLPLSHSPEFAKSGVR